MRKVIIICISLCISAQLSAFSWDFFKVSSKYESIENFSSKTTMVVLPYDGSIPNIMLRQVIKEQWYLSPYEYCTQEEFETLKTNPDYYFLIKVVETQGDKELLGVEKLSLRKGGAQAQEGIDKMPELISIPLQILDSELTDDEIQLISLSADIIQDYVIETVRMEGDPYIGAELFSSLLEDVGDVEILFSEDCLAHPVDKYSILNLNMAKEIVVLEDHKFITSALDSYRPSTLIPLIISASGNVADTKCYKFLISTQTKRVVYYSDHTLSKRKPRGFLKKDIRAIVKSL